jgi:hypothetical protein
MSVSTPEKPKDPTESKGPAPIKPEPPKKSSSLTVYKSALPEHRPIGPSNIQVAFTYGGGLALRPVEHSALKVVSTYRSPEQRPIMVDTLQIARVENMYGARPVGVSTLKVDRTENAFGVRPVASNQIDEEPLILMGYLD